MHKAAARRLQRDEYELALAAETNAVLFFDNVSSMPQWLSDALACLATGSGYAVRVHYSQDEERVYGTALPVCCNGIPDFAESSDLLDRAVRITCLPIAEPQRQDERTLQARFEPAYPRILGALLDAVSRGLRHYDEVTLQLPRMARSSARWIAACETGQAGLSFYEAYARNRRDLTALALEHSPIATTLLTWLEELPVPDWEGSATELLAILANRAEPVVLWSNQFPKAANKLSAELKRLVPVLRPLGVEVDIGRSNARRTIAIRKPAEGAVQMQLAEGNGKPGLCAVSEGRIPEDRPYQLHRRGKECYVSFQMSKEEVSQLPESVQSELLNGYRDERGLKVNAETLRL